MVEVYSGSKLLFRASGVNVAIWWLSQNYNSGTYTIVKYTFDSGIVDDTVGSTEIFDITIRNKELEKLIEVLNDAGWDYELNEVGISFIFGNQEVRIGKNETERIQMITKEVAEHVG